MVDVEFLSLLGASAPMLLSVLLEVNHKLVLTFNSPVTFVWSMWLYLGSCAPVSIPYFLNERTFVPW